MGQRVFLDKERYNPAVAFEVLDANFANVLRIYKDNNFKLYDYSKFFTESSEIYIQSDIESVLKYIETGHYHLNFKGNFKKNNGCLIPDDLICISDMLAIGSETQLEQTFSFMNLNIIREISIIQNVARQAAKAQLLISSNKSDRFPGVLGQASDDRRTLLASLVMTNLNSDQYREFLEHITIYSACIILEVRLEALIFFRRNETKIRRIHDEIKRYDEFGRIDCAVFGQRIFGLASAKFHCRYDAFLEDIAYLCLSTSKQTDIVRDGIGFELACLEKLISSGYTAELTSATGDYGADIIAEKNGLTFCIQCKALNRPTGVKAVQEVIAAHRKYITDYAIVISATEPTRAARELAASCDVLIIDLEAIPSLGQRL